MVYNTYLYDHPDFCRVIPEFSILRIYTLYVIFGFFDGSF